jgi:thiamine-phosphate pyrophosphorylase
LATPARRGTSNVVRGLYAIADLDALDRRGLALLPFATAVLAGRPAALQLRAKSASPEQTLALLRELLPLCRRAGVPLVVNDRVDLAIVSGADMLHLGQGDGSPALARSLAPKLALGLSTHTPEELNGALNELPTYVAYGPVYPTRSKEQPDPVVGLAGLRQAAHLVRYFGRSANGAPPLVAIGGITLERVVEVARHVSCAAVIGDLLPPEDLSGDDAYEFVQVRTEQFGAAFADPTALAPAGDIEGVRP